jgi:hypothetical protein
LGVLRIGLGEVEARCWGCGWCEVAIASDVLALAMGGVPTVVAAMLGLNCVWKALLFDVGLLSLSLEFKIREHCIHLLTRSYFTRVPPCPCVNYQAPAPALICTTPQEV